MLVFVAVGILVRQRGPIIGAIRDAMQGGAVVLEVQEFGCEGGFQVRVTGRVKNKSDKPLSLSVNLGLRVGSGPPRLIRTGTRVEPYPLPPGSTGSFDFRRSEFAASGGKCLLHSFNDDERGEAMNYTADARLTNR